VENARDVAESTKDMAGKATDMAAEVDSYSLIGLLTYYCVFIVQNFLV
jgi:hypothetical protein